MDRAQKFLVVYDHGMGGVWGAVIAPTAQDVIDKFPELIVVSERPTWMTAEYHAGLLDEAIGLDGPFRGVLKAVLADRRHE